MQATAYSLRCASASSSEKCSTEQELSNCLQQEDFMSTASHRTLSPVRSKLKTAACACILALAVLANFLLGCTPGFYAPYLVKLPVPAQPSQDVKQNGH